MDNPLINDGEIDVKTIDLGDAHCLYVKNKHHSPIPVESESDSEDE